MRAIASGVFFRSNCQELIDTFGFRPLIRLLSIWITYHRIISIYGTILCRIAQATATGLMLSYLEFALCQTLHA